MYGKLFLPAVGYRQNSGPLDLQGIHGRYWSSEHASSNVGRDLYFSSSSSEPDRSTGGKMAGFSIRCVT